MTWQFSNDRPIYTQLMEQIQLKIICGEYKAGEKFPSVRELAAEASVNPNTMQKALSELERNGLVYSQRTSGRFITEDIKMIDNLRKTFAHNEIKLFLSNMKKIGFTKDEIINLLQNVKEEMN